MINYYLITKPGIIMGNLITVAAGLFLASKGTFIPILFLATLLGLALIIASACVFNNFIDRHRDQKMQRTQNRALATKSISAQHAILFAIFLGIAGNSILFIHTNILTVCVAGIGFLIYVCLYSLWKGHTVYATAIGSIAGAIPPVVGYCAVSNTFDAGAMVLFTMLVLWQMPHFFAIALLHFDDYVRAGLPLLPIKKGILRTKVHMLLYTTGFIPTAALLTLLNYTGFVYLIVALTIGCIWLGLCIKGFRAPDNRIWGRTMFRFSLVLIMAISLTIPFDTV